MDNPYLEAWKGNPRFQRKSKIGQELTDISLLLQDMASLEEIKPIRDEHARRYSYAIPTEEAIRTIAGLSPLVEIGAGTGYWAWLLRQAGADIVCYDAHPPSPTASTNKFHRKSSCWTEVLRGDEMVLDGYSDRTLFLCWPPVREDMAFRVLNQYRGNRFAFVGEPALGNGLKGSTGNAEFYDLLEQNWKLQRALDLPHWPACWDSLLIYQRA